MPTLSCANCGNSFDVIPARIGKAKFCSRSCKGSFNYKITLQNIDHSHSIGNKHRAGKRPTNAFPVGHTAWNKDLKGIHLSPHSEFKKGQNNCIPVPVGTIRIRVFRGVSRAHIKIAEPNAWVFNARHVWESFNGPIPVGMVIHHVDFNSLNDSPLNLVCIDRKDHLALHRCFSTSE